MLELGSLDQLIGFALESLDVPKELQARAKAVYDDCSATITPTPRRQLHLPVLTVRPSASQ